MTKTKRTRVAIYARVSTSDKGQDPENQLRKLRRWCKDKGYPIEGEYVDHESGRKGAADRAQFRKLLDGAGRRDFDLVLVWRLDRLTREGLAATVHYLQRFDSHGVGFHSFEEPMLSTEDEFIRDVLIGLLSALAKVQAKKISDDTKAGLERAAKQGRKGGRPRAIVNKTDAKRIRSLHAKGTSER